jgi:hypothetical protein
MIIYMCILLIIKMNLFDKNLNENNFLTISDKILNQIVLHVVNKKFRICEIEMYLKTLTHPDQYVHSNPDQ